ncbi:HVO_A0114 family putative DNA-binding protein [Azohydromonas aeria]|uniref:HVO_A0114 family putative DNA-binding protein n=1 Tax=Azohydromonas aeria TaxID=2590212 RepID=UPI0012FBE63E|nr:MarR family transcriptional regulator [Azohydromonas aeria]
MTQQRTLTITLQPDWRAALRAAGTAGSRTDYQGEVLNFETAGALFARLTERRWDLVHALQGQGSMTVRELARRIGRDARRVQEDVKTLAELGLVERNDAGDVVCPFSEIHVDLHLRGAGRMAA